MTNLKRALCLLLSLVLLAGLFPAALPAEAVEYTPEGKPAELTTAEGEKVEVDAESWEELYPYGAFLFETGETNLTEGGEAGLIRLYRLGGTSGRATAYVYYNPTIMALDEETLSYASAISGGDIRIEVEDALYRFPAVAACAVVARPDDKWGETPLAFVELKPGQTATEEELIAHCRTLLARFKVPRHVLFEDIPKTSTGKIQKFELRKRARLMLD